MYVKTHSLPGQIFGPEKERDRSVRSDVLLHGDRIRIQFELRRMKTGVALGSGKIRV